MMKMADENSGDTQVWLDLASAQHWGGVGVYFFKRRTTTGGLAADVPELRVVCRATC